MDVNESGRPYRRAGLSQSDVPGISVAEAAERLRRLAYYERRLMRLYASRVVMLAERDIKVLLARLQYEASQHSHLLRRRVLELRTPKNKVDRSPDKRLTALFNEAEYVPGAYPYVAVLVELLLPELLAAYEAYLASTNDLADYPSVRVIRRNLQESEEHLQLLQALLQDMPQAEGDEAEAESWLASLRDYLVQAGGVLGREASRDVAATAQPPRERLVVPHELQRDGTFERVWDYTKAPLEETKPHLDYMMGLRLSEMNVAEGLALVLCNTENMPWSFYADISRHLWDEMRHSLFGEVAIEATYGDRAAIPMRDYEGVFAFEAELLEQYAVLGLEIEGGNMKYPPGKRLEWEFCRDMAEHPLMTTFQDFDWADEVLHVQIARRQLDKWFEGGMKELAAYAKRGRKHRTAVKERKEQTPATVKS